MANFPSVIWADKAVIGSDFSDLFCPAMSPTKILKFSDVAKLKHPFVFPWCRSCG